MSDPTTPPPPRKPLLERPGGAFVILLCIFGGGLLIGAILAKLRPPEAASNRPTSGPVQTRPSTDRSTFNVGDQIELTLSDPAAPGSQTTRVYTVDEQGTIPIPLLGPLNVRGHAPAKLEQAIAQAYHDRNLIANMQVQVKRASPPTTAPTKKP